MKGFLTVIIGIQFLISCKEQNHQHTRIAFGSCGKQTRNQPVLAFAALLKPDAFIFLGDNIYGDTRSVDTLRLKYEMLAAKPEFQLLKQTTKIYATWDDHDYGWNDAGRHYAVKEESKQAFLNFFGEQGDTTLIQHEGIYHSAFLEKDGKRIQLNFLDMRTFRDDLLPYNGNRKNDARFNYLMDYSPYSTPDSTLLGEQQWQWLENQLRQPADLRIIASSTQFGITHNGYEAWANFPHEQNRLLELIRKTKAEGIVVISGDVHYAEISRLDAPGLYPIYDITSSGITSTWEFATPNDNRIDGPIMENHFGLLTIDWKKNEILAEIIDVTGRHRIKRVISVGELRFP